LVRGLVAAAAALEDQVLHELVDEVGAAIADRAQPSLSCADERFVRCGHRSPAVDIS
jgi:DICT domain-containing protein